MGWMSPFCSASRERQLFREETAPNRVQANSAVQSAAFLVHFLLGNAGCGMREFHPMSL
jgi:hypothetical protein